jgi:hypothetical protein
MVESDIPNPDTAPQFPVPGTTGTAPAPLKMGPVVYPAPPSGVGVPGLDLSVPLVYIVTPVCLVFAAIAFCWWRRRRRMRARTSKQKRRRSEYTKHEELWDDMSSSGDSGGSREEADHGSLSHMRYELGVRVGGGRGERKRQRMCSRPQDPLPASNQNPKGLRHADGLRKSRHKGHNARKVYGAPPSSSKGKHRSRREHDQMVRT